MKETISTRAAARAHLSTQWLSTTYRYYSPAITCISHRLETLAHAKVLDFGPARESTIERLAQSGPRLTITDVRELFFQTPLQLEADEDLEEPSEPPRLTDLREALPKQERFDVILCWDLLNYLDELEVQSFLKMLSSLCSKDCLIFTLMASQPLPFLGPMQCSLLPDNQIQLVPSPDGQPMKCFCKSSDLLDSLTKPEIASSTRLRNGFCELLICNRKAK